jgi:hypothetical protein
VAIALTIVIICLVAFLAITHRDVQRTRPDARADRARWGRGLEPAPDPAD